MQKIIILSLGLVYISTVSAVPDINPDLYNQYTQSQVNIYKVKHGGHGGYHGHSGGSGFARHGGNNGHAPHVLSREHYHSGSERSYYRQGDDFYDDELDCGLEFGAASLLDRRSHRVSPCY